MSEKVILTAEQAEAIEHFRRNGSSNAGILDNHFYKHYDSEFYKRLSDVNIDTDRLVSALYNGYEVEGKFKSGDKIVNSDGSIIAEGKFIATYESGNAIMGIHFLKEIAGAFMGPKFRIATPEEIYWLETLGREKVPDFHEGDAITTFEDDEISLVVKDDGYINEKVGIRNAEDWYKSGIFKGLYPAESFKPFTKEESK